MDFGDELHCINDLAIKDDILNKYESYVYDIAITTGVEILR